MHEPRRSALGLLYEILGDEAGRFAGIWFKDAESKTIMRMLKRRVNCPRTSSMGRLFDAVAVLCGLPKITTFEGQAAMALEFAADKDEPSAYAIPLRHDENQDLIADWEPMFRVILADLVPETCRSALFSARFHNALADLAVDIASSVELNKVVLYGRVFSERLVDRAGIQSVAQSGLFSVSS